MKILISDSLSKQGVDLLEKAGFSVVVKSKLSKEEKELLARLQSMEKESPRKGMGAEA